MPIDAFGCLIFEATFDIVPIQTPWVAGPMPLSIPSSQPESSATQPEALTDEARRRGYFAERIHPILYGSEDGSQTARWHLFLPDGHQSLLSEARVDGWELVVRPGGSGYAVAHMQLGEQPVASLSGIVTDHDLARSQIAGTLPPGIRLGARRPRIVSHLMWSGAAMPSLSLNEPSAQALTGWSDIEKWLWFLASGVGPERMLPDTEALELSRGIVHLSHDWRALALRDGVAYVAMTSKGGGRIDGVPSFHLSARVYVRSIHLDAVLLGCMQVAAIHDQADAVSQISVRTVGPAEVEELEARLLEMRTGLLWNNLAVHSRQPSDVLAAFQRQHHLPELYRRIVDDLSDAGRYIQAREAALAEIDRKADDARRDAAEAALRKEDKQRDEFERAVSLVTFVLLPVSLIFSGAALWTDPSPRLFFVGFSLSLLVVVVFAVLSPSLRNALRRRRQT